MSADYAPAISLEDSRIGYGGWSPTNRRWIIVHGTAGDATIEAVQATFINNAAAGRPSSTHYAVGEGGEVGQYVPESAVAWGNGPISGPAGTAVAGQWSGAHDAWWDSAYPGNANPDTFSIEHCKSDTSNAAALTPAQKAASFALIKHLCERWGIPKRVYGTSTPANSAGGITGHFSMDPQNRAFCPGAYPWQELQSFLDGAPMSIQFKYDASGRIVSGYDTDNPAMIVGEGIAQTISNKGWAGAEIFVSTDDNAKQQLPSGVKIAVLRGVARVVITWSPAGGIETFGNDAVLAIEDLYGLWQAAQAALTADLAAQTREEAAEQMPAPTSREHVVQAGQTLASISASWYGGDSSHGPAIFAANRDRMISPDSMSTGMVLVIPELAPSTALAADPAPVAPVANEADTAPAPVA